MVRDDVQLTISEQNVLARTYVLSTELRYEQSTEERLQARVIKYHHRSCRLAVFSAANQPPHKEFDPNVELDHSRHKNFFLSSLFMYKNSEH